MVFLIPYSQLFSHLIIFHTNHDIILFDQYISVYFPISVNQSHTKVHKMVNLFMVWDLCYVFERISFVNIDEMLYLQKIQVVLIYILQVLRIPLLIFHA